MSIAIGTHFCGGEAIESKLMLAETDLGCAMTDMEDSCADSEDSNLAGDSIEKTPCCKNEYQTVQATDDFVKDATQITFNVDFALALLSSTPNLKRVSKSNQKHLTEYNTPTIEKDVQKLFQTYLI